MDPNPCQNDVFVRSKVTYFGRRHMMDAEACSYRQTLQEPPELDEAGKGSRLALCWATALWTP